ncbi:MAG: hypothetical protein KC897_03665 [Candidatus Omnitrophica bacterium]|nr:hypothetical protein [Candidatus Omnitrophota bacterium]MCB9719482.1 hypothetical protein [Candidatus Omnitrophota bacterium]
MRTNLLILIATLTAVVTVTYAADRPRVFKHEVDAADMRKARTYVHAIVNSVLEGDFDQIRKYGEKLDELTLIKGEIDPTQYEGSERARAEQFLKNNEYYHASVKTLIKAASEYSVEETFKVAEDITRSCVACHAQFGQNRFPAFQRMSPSGNGKD